MKLEAKIKGVWVSYNYSINCSHTALPQIIRGLKENGFTQVEFLGKSKAYKLNGEIHHLKSRSLFFNIHK